MKHGNSQSFFLIKYFFISSGLFPFVSGMRKSTKSVPTAQTPPYKKNAPDALMACSMLYSNLVTKKAQSQLNELAMVDAMPLASKEKNSPFITQGKGPKPTEKATM